MTSPNQTSFHRKQIPNPVEVPLSRCQVPGTAQQALRDDDLAEIHELLAMYCDRI